jgi:tetratricopeptide (TPR) repeat protein
MNSTVKSAAKYASLEAALEAVRAARSPAGSPIELEAAEAAVAFAPERSDLWIVLAGAANRLANHARAEEAQLKALDLTTDPLMKDRLEVDRAWTLAGQKRWAEAAVLARRPRPALATDAISRNILGATLASIGYGAEAVDHLEFAVRGLPERPDIRLNLAVVYRSLGRNSDAEATLEEILKIAPGYLPAYEFLGELRKATPDSNLVERLNAVRARLRPGPDTAYLDYSLFRQLDELDRRDEAWATLSRAARTRAATMPWTVAQDEATAAAMRSLQATIPPRPAEKDGGPRSIFIVGLPRTGSTLVERIFAAHPKVRALGELETFGRALKAAAGLPSDPYIDARVAEAGSIDWDGVGASYRKEVAGLADGAGVVTDKLPLNWWYAPAITAALPDATIVHVQRSPMDALFGAYKQLLTQSFAWSYSQDDLADHYGVYRRLMQDWRGVLGERLVEVDYDSLVVDPQARVRELLAGCDLEFDPACLSPESAQGAVNTPSASQVREPMTAANVGAWRRYAAQLEPLRARLEADGWVDANGDGVVR